MLLFILSLLCGLTALSIDMNLPAYGSLQQAFHTDESHVQLTLSLFLIGYSVGQLICGPMSDHFGRRPVLLWGLVLFTVSGFLCGISQSLYVLISFRFVQGAAASVGAVLSRAIIRDIYNKEQIASALSRLTQVVMIAPMLAPILGTIVLNVWGWRAIFYTLTALGMISWLAAYTKLPETLKQRDHNSGNLRHVFKSFVQIIKHPVTFRYMVANCLVYSAMFCYVSMSPFIYMEVYKIPRTYYGLLMAVPVLFLVFGATANKFLLKRHVTETLLQWGINLTVFSGLVMCALVLMQIPHIAVVILPMCMYMFALGIVSPNLTAVAISPYPNHAGVASSLIGGLQTFVAAIASAIATYFYTQNAASFAIAVGVLTLASAILSYTATPKSLKYFN